MAVKTTQIISCDHIHSSDGKQCPVERAQSKIDPIEPMYHLTVKIEVIDADGTHEMVNEDVYLCFWDLYYHLSAFHDQAKIDVASRKAKADVAKTAATQIIDLDEQLAQSPKARATVASWNTVPQAADIPEGFEDES